jgi:hypothetical protein
MLNQLPTDIYLTVYEDNRMGLHIISYLPFTKHALTQWFRHCATNRKAAGSIPDGVIGIFY